MDFDLTTPQIRAIQRTGVGMPYEVRLQRANGDVVVEFLMSVGGLTYKIVAVTMAGGIEPDRHI